MQKGDKNVLLVCLQYVIVSLLSCVVPTQVCAELACEVKANMQH